MLLRASIERFCLFCDRKSFTLQLVLLSVNPLLTSPSDILLKYMNVVVSLFIVFTKPTQKIHKNT